MSKQQKSEHTRRDLMSAFRIFDEDDDGCIHAGDLVDVLTSFGERFSKSEARKLVQTASKKEDGLIDYQGEYWISGLLFVIRFILRVQRQSLTT